MTAINAATCIQDYLEASSHHRAQLIVAEKSRQHASYLLDSDYDRVSGYMARWRERYIERTARHCNAALCIVHGHVRDTSAAVLP
jgi:hypothetical protein